MNNSKETISVLLYLSSYILLTDLAAYFQLTNLAGTITLQLTAQLPENVAGFTRILLLELEASDPHAVSAFTMIVLDNSADDVLTLLVFTEAYYTGAYTEQGLMFNSSIAISNGNSGAVTYALEGGKFMLNAKIVKLKITFVRKVKEEKYLFSYFPFIHSEKVRTALKSLTVHRQF